MKTRELAAVVVVILTMVFCPVVMADITGSWDVTGVMKTKVAIKKYGSDASKEVIADFFEFGSDQSFSMMDLPDGGTWEYFKKKVLVRLEEQNLQDFFKDELESMLWEEAAIAATVDDIVILKNNFSVQERKNGTIKGKSTIGLACVINVAGYNPLPSNLPVGTWI